jgi:starch synthase
LADNAQNTAIYYHPEAYTITGPKLMGRNAAGESFLRGLLAHSHHNTFWLQVDNPAHAQSFAQAAQAAGRREPIKAVDRRALGALSQAGTVYHPGPGIGGHAWQRAAHGHGAWSLCGITHTTSSARAMDAIAELLTAPVQPWDALICTSTAVKDNVDRLIQAQAEHLHERLGAQRIVLPQLPVIPLGIHTRDFEFNEGQRQQARQAIGADEHTHVVLFMGRLSFHAKAHPLAMYQALEHAAAALPPGQRVVLVECGWHANESIAKAFVDAASLACPSVRVLHLDGREATHRQTAWASADIFCSLSDNIQETFGLVPVEAMAAGLPVVVSDWDGYRDTVRDGIDGYRIPTLMPAAGLGTDLALRHALEIDNYDMYCGLTCALVSVDIQATAQALTRLMASPALRQQMGAAARQRAQEHYDWAAIIPQYEALWARQNERRQAQTLPTPAQPWPARMDPFHAFAAYPSQTLNPQTILALVDADITLTLARLERYRALAMVSYASTILVNEQELQSMLQAAAQGPKTAAGLISHLQEPQRPHAFRSLTWLLKMGLLQAQGCTVRPDQEA